MLPLGSVHNSALWTNICKLVASAFVIGAIGEGLSVFAITLERCVYINWPFKHSQWITETKTVKFITIILLVVIVGGLLFIFTQDRWVCFVHDFIRFCFPQPNWNTSAKLLQEKDHHFRQMNVHHCSVWELIDPAVQAGTWLPLFAIISVISISVYVRMGYLSKKVQREIETQRNSVTTTTGRVIDKAQWKTTVNLLLVIGIYVLTNTGEEKMFHQKYSTP